MIAMTLLLMRSTPIENKVTDGHPELHHHRAGIPESWGRFRRWRVVSGMTNQRERWEPGDIVLAADRSLWCRAQDHDVAQGWPWSSGPSTAPKDGQAVREGHAAEDDPVRPLTLLVRNGKPAAQILIERVSEAIESTDRGFVRADDPETTRWMQGWDECRGGGAGMSG
jgi:hypothetical protein